MFASAGRFVIVGQVMVGQPHRVPANNTKVLTTDDNAEDQFAYNIMKITSAKMKVKHNCGVCAGIHMLADGCYT